MMTAHNDAIKFEPVSGVTKKILVYNEKIMLVENYLKKGSFVPKHNHTSQQLTYVVEGKLLLEIDGKKSVLQKGDSIIISEGILHSAVGLEESFVLDFYSPPRQDFLEQIQQYKSNRCK